MLTTDLLQVLLAIFEVHPQPLSYYVQLSNNDTSRKIFEARSCNVNNNCLEH